MALAAISGAYAPNQPADGVALLGDLTALETRINAVTAEQIAAGAVVQSKIAANAVITGKLADGVLSADSSGRAKMADAFITTAKLGALSVDTAALADGAVTLPKIATGSTILQLKVGTFAGNSSTTNAITGVGFQPDIIFVQNQSNPQFVSLGLKALASGSPVKGPFGVIQIGNLGAATIQYDADGFTVLTADSHVNGSGITYGYVCIKAL